MRTKVVKNVIVGVCVGCFTVMPVGAYKESTHRLMIGLAFTNSVISKLAFWKRLGFDLDPNTKKFVGSTGVPKLVVELLQDGVEFEDELLRPVNHFFNPIDGSALSIPLAVPAPSWALDDGAFAIQQGKSYRDARESYYEALTATQKEQRENAFGATVEKLGHVVHLIQDMAQPQHVRNDAHLDWKGAALLHDPSLFEFHAEASIYSFLFAPYPNAYMDAAPNSVTAAREFWQSQPNSTSGKGLAEFTNRNFISQKTNFRGTLAAPLPYALFPLPVVTTIGPPIDASLVDPTLPSGHLIRFVTTAVVDSLNPALGGQNFRASSLSIFDDDLKIKGEAPRFSNTTYNIDAALAFLIPRAVSYSTGMIDYFFRGEMDLAPDDLNMGKYVIRNMTSETMTGWFELFFDTSNQERYPVPGAKWELTIPGKNTATGAPGVSGPIAVREPAGAQGGGNYVLVFRGELGNERKSGANFGAVVGGKVKAAPLEGLYVAGLDSQGRTITVRVDENGTQLLSGPDSSGIIKSTAGFNPLANAGGIYLRKKPSNFKQVKFLDGPGGTRYRIVAYRALTSAALRNPDTLDYASGACCWQAKSVDPTVGSFTFDLGASSDGSVGSLSYVREYVDAYGQVQSATGSVALPPLPGFSTTQLASWGYASPYGGTPPVPRANYRDVAINGPVLSSDGLTVYGLLTANTVSTPPLPWTGGANSSQSQVTTVNVISLRIQLAATPSATVVVDETLTSTYHGSDASSGGEVRWDPWTGCLGSVGVLKNYNDTFTDRATNWTNVGRIFVGSFDGAVRSYQITGGTAGHHTKRARYKLTHPGSPCDYDIVLEVFDNVDGGATTNVVHQMLDGPMRIQSHFGDVEIYRFDPNPATQWHVHVDPVTAYQTMTPVPWGTFTSTTPNGPEDPDVSDPAIVFAPYTSAVVHYRQTSKTAGAKLAFRGIDLHQKDFVGDASPLGEMFFALSDGSLVIHEPRGGRMPIFVKPANMVKIIAALWL